MENILWGALAVLLIMAVMVFQAMRGVLIRKNYFLPAVVYLLAVVRLVPLYGLSNTLIAAICFSFLFYFVEQAVIRQHSNAPVFGIGVSSLLVAALVPKLVLFIPFGLLALALIARFSVKDISALFVGWITAALFLFTWLFCTDQFMAAWGNWIEELMFMSQTGIGSAGEWIRLAILFVLILWMIVAGVTKFMPALYTERRFISVVIATPVAIGVSAILFSGINHDMIYVSALPIAWIASYFYQSGKSIGAKVIFYAYLILSLIPIS